MFPVDGERNDFIADRGENDDHLTPSEDIGSAPDVYDEELCDDV